MMHVARVPMLQVDPFLDTDLLTHLRVGREDYDEAMRQARAAAAEIETFGSLALLQQAVRITFLEWDGECILHLPIGPMTTAQTCTILINGVAFTDFQILKGPRPVIWFTEVPPAGPMLIDYECGFGPTADAIPDDLRHAIMDQAAAYYDARGAGDGKSQLLSPHAARIAARYRRVGL